MTGETRKRPASRPRAASASSPSSSTQLRRPSVAEQLNASPPPPPPRRAASPSSSTQPRRLRLLAEQLDAARRSSVAHRAPTPLCSVLSRASHCSSALAPLLVRSCSVPGYLWRGEETEVTVWKWVEMVRPILEESVQPGSTGYILIWVQPTPRRFSLKQHSRWVQPILTHSNPQTKQTLSV
jgi:hypothetical protein